MDMKVKEKAKQHVDALKGMADAAGMSVEDLVEEVLGEESAEEGGMEEEGEDEGEGEGEEMGGHGMGPRRDKIALIVARMKKAKEE